MSNNKKAAQMLTEFQNLCIDFATGTETKYEDYEESRNRVLAEPVLLHRLPDWVSKTRFGSQFWILMKETSSTYAGRRKFIYEFLSPVYDYLENSGIEPSSLSFEEALKNCDSKVIEELWQKIHARRARDPKGTC
jgi:hypothetical protein